MRKRWTWIVIAILVVGAIGAFFFLRARGQAAAQANFETQPAAHGDLTATVGATGVVRANQTALLVWQTSGTVGQVDVNVSEPVTKDQVLATLEQTSLPQTVILAQADLVNAQRALDDLLNSQLQQAQAQQALEKARQALEDAQNPEATKAKAQQAVADAQKAVENADRALRDAQSPAGQSFIDQAQAQVVLAQDALEQAQKNFEPYANKPEDNLVRARFQSELSSAQQRYDAAVRQLNGLLGTTNLTDQAVAQANLETARAQLADAQREWERVKDGTSPAEMAVLAAQLADAEREAGRVKDGPDPNDVAAAQARVAAAQAALKQASITAPFAGSITQVESKQGDQASPGALAFRLDDLSRLLVDVQVSEVDINRIQSGQAVSLVFDAILSKEYHGTVSEVSLVGSTNQGVVDFTVTVELTDADQDVKPGMTAAVNIVVSQLKGVLLVPNRAVRVLDGKRVVYVLRGGFPQPVNVQLGASSDVSSEVVGGELKEGDAIVLNPPAVFEQNGPPPFARGGNQ
jgi:HlyD family secretion protein